MEEIQLIFSHSLFKVGDTLRSGGRQFWRSFLWGRVNVYVEYTMVITKGPTMTLEGNSLYLCKKGMAEFYINNFNIYTRLWKTQ